MTPSFLRGRGWMSIPADGGSGVTLIEVYELP
jgi:hypothetical protein